MVTLNWTVWVAGPATAPSATAIPLPSKAPASVSAASDRPAPSSVRLLGTYRGAGRDRICQPRTGRDAGCLEGRDDGVGDDRVERRDGRSVGAGDALRLHHGDAIGAGRFDHGDREIERRGRGGRADHRVAAAVATPREGRTRLARSGRCRGAEFQRAGRAGGGALQQHQKLHRLPGGERGKDAILCDSQVDCGIEHPVGVAVDRETLDRRVETLGSRAQDKGLGAVTGVGQGEADDRAAARYAQRRAFGLQGEIEPLGDGGGRRGWRFG